MKLNIKRPMKFRFVLSAFLALLLPLSPALPVVAEDAVEEQQTSSPQTEAPNSKTTSNTAPKTKSKSRPSEREFDPSEEISEDLSVPFPVDI
jgi:hypothetical protein